MKIISKLIVASITFLFVSCEKSTVWMSYAQTQCADPWQMLIEDMTDSQNVLDAVEEYLLTEYDVKVLDSEINMNDPGMVCLACSCTSGNTIRIKVKDTVVENLSELGFQ